MKLVMFKTQGETRLGCLVNGNEVVDLNLAYEAMLREQGDLRAKLRASVELPSDMISFLEGEDSCLSNARKVKDWVEEGTNKQLCVRGIPLVNKEGNYKLKAPVKNPEKIICVAHNYHDFCEEVGITPHDEPRLFSKFANAVAAWDEPVIRPAMTQALGYEAELGFVVGRKCKHVTESEALNYIAGYMVFNDISASDLTKKDVQNTRGKGFDTFAVMGPYLLTRDMMPDPHNLDVKLRLNGEILQSSNTKQLVHNVPQIMSFCSRIFTLKPGDVVATGTPGGLAKDRNPPTYMVPGDIMETEIEGLGIARNPVVDEEI